MPKELEACGSSRICKNNRMKILRLMKKERNLSLNNKNNNNMYPIVNNPKVA